MSRQELLYRLGLFCVARKYLILFFVSLITAIFTYFAFQIEIKLGVFSLLDEKDPEVMRVHYVNNNFSGMSYTFVAVTADTAYQAKKYADALAETLVESNLISRVDHKFDINALMKYGFLFLETDEINEFKAFVQENQTDLISIFKDVHTARFLTGFNHMIERQIIEKDEIEDTAGAMDLLDAFNDFLDGMDIIFRNGRETDHYRIKRSLRNLFVRGIPDEDSIFEDEYMLSKDKKTVLLMVVPAEHNYDMVFAHQFMTDLNQSAASLAATIPNAGFQIAGNIAVMHDEYNAIRRDTLLSTALSSLLVLIIFFVFFRKLSDLLLIGVCLLFGILWTYGLAYLFIGFLGLTTSFFSAILIGLGIDFAIHLIARYSEYRNEGETVEKAVALAMGGSGPGILIGSATTAAAFFVMVICRFNGISQLGLVAGTGVLSVTVIMLTLLPSMIAIRDSNAYMAGRRFRVMRTLPLFSELAGFMVRHRWTALVLITLITVVMVAAATRIAFNYDFRSLEPRGSKAIAANQNLEKKFGRSVDYGLVFAETMDQSRKLAKILKTKDSVEKVYDTSMYIPVNQQEKIILIKAIEPLLVTIVVDKCPEPDETFNENDIRELAFSLRESRRMFLAVKQIAILDGYFDVEEKCTEIMARALKLANELDIGQLSHPANVSYYQHILATELQDLLANLKTAAEAKPMGIEQLPQTIQDRYIGKDGRFILYAYPKGYIWTRDKLERIATDLRSVSKASTSTGLVFLELIEKIKEDFRSAVWLSLLMVFILVWAGFRRFVTTLAAMVPLVLGTLWMLGTMAMLGLTFNLVNVAVVPLIIGIGIDDGVHLIHRYRTEPIDPIRTSTQHTGQAIFLTSITTMAGFGSLGLASYTAFATLGWVLLIGVFYCLVTSVIVLPVFLSILEDLKINI